MMMVCSGNSDIGTVTTMMMVRSENGDIGTVNYDDDGMWWKW